MTFFIFSAAVPPNPEQHLSGEQQHNNLSCTSRCHLRAHESLKGDDDNDDDDDDGNDGDDDEDYAYHDA